MMDTFAIPPGFIVRHTQTGLVLARGDLRLRCVSRVRPIAHPHAILAALDPTARRSLPRVIATSSTDEGELALRTGDIVGDTLARDLAAIVGDDFAATIVGVAPIADAAELAALVDELARTTRLHLGVRRRRYLYTPPAGWQRFSLDGMDTHYLAPEHPRVPCCLTVYAAVPGDDTLAAWWHDAPAALAGGDFDPLPLIDEDLVVGGFTGRRVQLSGRDAERELVADLVCLADRAYSYPLVLVGDAARASSQRDVMDALVASIAPLARRPRNDVVFAALEHWCA